MQEVDEELFPCYLFARFELSKFYWIIKYTRGVRRLVGIFYKDLKPHERVLILLNTLSYQARMEIDRQLLAKA